MAFEAAKKAIQGTLWSENMIILVYLSIKKKIDPKSAILGVSHSARGGGLDPNETLSLSNGKFVFDHGPKGRHPKKRVKWDFVPKGR